jgi:hypothetical protein
MEDVSRLRLTPPLVSFLVGWLVSAASFTSRPASSDHPPTANYGSTVGKCEDSLSSLQWPVTNRQHANHATSWGNTNSSPQGECNTENGFTKPIHVSQIIGQNVFVGKNNANDIYKLWNERTQDYLKYISKIWLHLYDLNMLLEVASSV